MRPMTSALPGEFRRNPLFLFGFLVFVAVAAWKAAEYIISGNLISLTYAVMILVAGAFVVAMLNNWRNGLYFFLFWLLFEDFARKFLGNNMAIYFAKDFLVLIVYLSFFLAYRRKKVHTFRPPFLIPLLIFVWFGVMQVFNPASSSLMYGVLGLKLYYYYIPLLFIGYALVDTEEALRRFYFINIGLALIIVSLGIAQAILGHTFLNPAHPADDIRELSQLYRMAPISGVLVYRPNSVFVSAGRFADYLLVIWLLAFGFSGYLLLRHRRGRSITFISLAVTFAAVALCASRGIFLWIISAAIVATAAFLWGAPWRQREVMRVMRTLQRAILGVVLGLGLLMVTYPEALLSRLAFYSETLSPDSPSSELMHRVRDYPLQNLLFAFDYPRWPYGYGIGTASLGVQYVSRIMQVPAMGIGVESGFGTLIVEMGIGGLALWLIMSASVLFAAWKVVCKLKGSPWFPLGFMIFWYAFLLLVPLTFYGMQPYQDFVLNAFLWLQLGILFRLPSIALSAQFAANAPSAQPRRSWIR
jgi:hypothetical protein